MKLLLAVSVVVLALFVLAEPSSAEPEEQTLKEKFNAFGDKVKDGVSKAHDKLKEAIKDIRESAAATKVSNWFKNTADKVKSAFSNK
ncbi:apolipoprotein C-I isoform 1-T2 [Gastrophryne carolinensis]